MMRARDRRAMERGEGTVFNIRIGDGVLRAWFRHGVTMEAAVEFWERAEAAKSKDEFAEALEALERRAGRRAVLEVVHDNPLGLVG